ncbi:MAG: hypothetical protein ACREQR_12225 [Candidatus Binataceae bacterium]
MRKFNAAVSALAIVFVFGCSSPTDDFAVGKTYQVGAGKHGYVCAGAPHPDDAEVDLSGASLNLLKGREFITQPGCAGLIEFDRIKVMGVKDDYLVVEVVWGYDPTRDVDATGYVGMMEPDCLAPAALPDFSKK